MARKPLLPNEEYFAKVPKKRVTAGVLFLNAAKDSLLMVKPWYKEYWSLPGGVADQRESPRSAAIREVREELGLNISEVTFLGISHLSKTEIDDVVHAYFYGGIIDDETFQSLKVDPDELDGCRFVPVGQLAEFAKVGSFASNLKDLIAAAQSGRVYYFEENFRQ